MTEKPVQKIESSFRCANNKQIGMLALGELADFIAGFPRHDFYVDPKIVMRDISKQMFCSFDFFPYELMAQLSVLVLSALSGGRQSEPIHFNFTQDVQPLGVRC